jgi:hypothetical protein
VQSAYRGAGAVRAPEFHGHGFGDAIDRGVTASRELERYDGVVRSDVRAYAFPFLWLRWTDAPARSAVIGMNAVGVPCIIA